MISSIVEQPKIYFLNVWTWIRPELSWGKFTKMFVVHINWLPGWSGCLTEPICISLPWTLFVWSSIRGVKNVSGLPVVLIHPIIKSWSFRGWVLDFIVKINPPSSKRHCFGLVATDYFTKWTEAVPLKDMIHSRGSIYLGLSHLHKMTWPIYDIVLESKTWLVRRCFSLFKCIFGLWDIFLGTQALPTNRGAYVDTQNWHD